MKPFLCGVALFAAVIAFVVFNTLYLDTFLDRTEARFARFPSSRDAYLSADDEKIKAYAALLDGIGEDWEAHDTYLHMSMHHANDRAFHDAFLPAVAYFGSGSYDDFLASLATARDVLKHIRYNESLCLGNLL